MTEDIEALNEFQIVDRPKDIGSETPYTKIARAAKLLANDKALSLPLSFFKTKNFKPSINSAAKRVGIQVKTVIQQGNVYIWKKN